MKTMGIFLFNNDILASRTQLFVSDVDISRITMPERNVVLTNTLQFLTWSRNSLHLSRKNECSWWRSQ